MLRKYFFVKNLCRHVTDNHSRDLQASNCAKERRLNRAKPRDVKDNSYKLSKRSIATFLLTNLRSRSDSAQRQILSNCHCTERGTLTREGLSNFVWSVLTQVLTLQLRRSVDLMVVLATLSWAFHRGGMLV